MKLLSVEQSRSAWLFPLVEINPSGKYLLPILVELIQRYKFADVPNIAETIKNNKGIEFKQGAFAYGKKGELSAELGVYSDGLVGDTKIDTEVSEAFLDDLLTWLQKEKGLIYPSKVRKQYVSKVYIETTKSLNSFSAKLEKFSKSISEKLGKLEVYGKPKFELGGVNFASEQTGPIATPIFRFERAENKPYAENRYYSFAGLPTKDHLQLIEQLEEILGG